MKLIPVTIEQLEALPVRGNHHQDSKLFDECHAFIVNEKNSMEDRIRALRVVDRAMGLGTEERVDEQAVIAYVNETGNC